ncbi:hypothetical protein C7999DRAFT_31461 [Corynascus novoguineensis]|uniref:Uncharacterized protein n=1 Tax=Corynascus novoguineensis TaxID=1126955 RepID=A0AAN7HFV3_9PEZI|nr:hypothetical protein C7999DRAFT_31461 [Corynascus novoguineensis]
MELSSPNPNDLARPPYVQISQVDISSDPVQQRDDVRSDHEAGGPAADQLNQIQKPYAHVSQADADSHPSMELKDSHSSPGTTEDSHQLPESRNAKGQPVLLDNGARFWDSSIHLLPLALTALLIAMNIQRWYWIHEEDMYKLWESPDTILSLFQFAAKVHELLVIASLGALTLKLFKRHLVGSRIPLGLLTGAYRVGDIPYIFSSSFHGAAWGSYWFLALVIFINTMLATLVGPSSAILMVPDLDWYPLPGAFNNIQEPRVYYNSPPNETWPRVVSAALLDQNDQLKGCDGLAGWYAYWCPAASYFDLRSWVGERANAKLDGDLTSQDPTGRVRRQLLSKESWNHQSLILTTVSLPPLVTFGRLLGFIEDASVDAQWNETKGIGTIADTPKFQLRTTGESTIFQPLVQTQCEVYDQAQLSNRSLPFYPTDGLDCLGDADCEDILNTNWVVEHSTNVSYDRPMFAYSTSTDTQKSALLASAALPYRNGSELGTYIVACSIIAHWMPASLSISPSESDFVESNVTDLVSREFSLKSPSEYFDVADNEVRPLINMTSDWLRYLFPRMNITLPDGTIEEESQMRGIFSPLIGNFSTGNGSVLIFNPATYRDQGLLTVYNSMKRTREVVQKIYGAVVTEGLARVASRSENWLVRSSNATVVVTANIRTELDNSDVVYDWSNGTLRIDGFESEDQSIKSPQEFLDHLAPMTRIDLEATRYGWGSGKVGWTMSFALAIMYAYFAIIATYFIYAALWPRLRHKELPYTIVSWGDMVDLVMLAWNSKPSESPRLKSSVQFRKAWPRPWKIEIGIRADATGRAQLTTTETGVEKLRRKVPYH